MASLLANNNNNNKNNNDDESKGGDDDSNDIEFLCACTDSQEIEIQATGKRGKITKKEILLRAIHNSNYKHNAGDGKNNNEINIADLKIHSAKCRFLLPKALAVAPLIAPPKAPLDSMLVNMKIGKI